MRSSCAAFVANSRWTRSLRSRSRLVDDDDDRVVAALARRDPGDEERASRRRSRRGDAPAARSRRDRRRGSATACSRRRSRPSSSSRWSPTPSSSRARSFANSTFRSRSTSSTPSFSRSSSRSSRSRSLSSVRKSSWSCVRICSIESARLPTSSGKSASTCDVEVARADLAGRTGDPGQAPSGQRGDQQAERGADAERDQGRLQVLVAHDAELLAQLGPQRVGDEGRAGAAVDRQPDRERRAVAAALDVAVARRASSGAPRGRSGRSSQVRPYDRWLEIGLPVAVEDEEREVPAARRVTHRVAARRRPGSVGLQRLRRGDAVADRELLAVAAERLLGIAPLSSATTATAVSAATPANARPSHQRMPSERGRSRRIGQFSRKPAAAPRRGPDCSRFLAACLLKIY